MEKSYEAPRLLVSESKVAESIAAGIASAVTSSATSSMTSCSAHEIDTDMTDKRSTIKVRASKELGARVTRVTRVTKKPSVKRPIR